jgi:trigger factor
MDIQITEQERTGAVRHLAVTVPTEAVQALEDRTARRYVSQARLPGFRPGKAPAAMVRKRFAQEIRQDALQQLVQEAYKTALEREQFDVVAEPHIHDLKFETGQPVTFTLHLEVRPEVTLTKVEGFDVVGPSAEVTEAMVQQQLETLRDQKATWAPVEEKPQPGDQVSVELAVAEADGTMQPPQQFPPFVVGQGNAIPAVEALILDAAPGETVEREITYPEDFPDESLRGAARQARLTVREVKRKSAPSLDDAFAREVGDFDSLEALTTTVRADLAASQTREADAETRAKLLDAIIDANPFDVPPTWVRQLIQSYANAYQVPEQDLPRFAQQFAPLAERQVRRDLVVDTIAKREALAATEGDVDAEVESLARQRNLEPGAVYAALQKANRLGEIEHGVTERKVFEWLTARNTVRAAAPGEQAEPAAPAAGAEGPDAG